MVYVFQMLAVLDGGGIAFIASAAMVFRVAFVKYVSFCCWICGSFADQGQDHVVKKG